MLFAALYSTNLKGDEHVSERRAAHAFVVVSGGAARRGLRVRIACRSACVSLHPHAAYHAVAMHGDT